MLISQDTRVSDNYRRLVSNSVHAVYSGIHDSKTVADLRERLLGKIRRSMQRLFNGNLMLEGLGDPLTNGTFLFSKGRSKNYLYKNLSGGEKAAFDLLLDLVVKTEEFDDTIYAIDEPELHMHQQ